MERFTVSIENGVSDSEVFSYVDGKIFKEVEVVPNGSGRISVDEKSVIALPEATGGGMVNVLVTPPGAYELGKYGCFVKGDCAITLEDNSGSGN